MKIKYIIPIILITLLVIQIPNGNALTINPLGRDIITYPFLETNNESVIFLYNSGLGYYESEDFYNGTVFDYFSIKTYVNYTSIISFSEFYQTVTVTYPNLYSFSFSNDTGGLIVENLGGYSYLKYTIRHDFPIDSFINQTGIYTFNITTNITTPSHTTIYDYKELHLNVTEVIGLFEDIDEPFEFPTFTYDAGFIGTLAGFICMFSLFAVPMVCAYKIKHTGEKLKWSVYGFILICIIFFCMIAFFQMG